MFQEFVPSVCKLTTYKSPSRREHWKHGISLHGFNSYTTRYPNGCPLRLGPGRWTQTVSGGVLFYSICETILIHTFSFAASVEVPRCGWGNTTPLRTQTAPSLASAPRRPSTTPLATLLSIQTMWSGPIITMSLFSYCAHPSISRWPHSRSACSRISKTLSSAVAR